MLIQLANIAGGFLLAAPGLKRYGNPETFDRIEAKTAPWLQTIGLIELGIGLVALLDRLGLIPGYLPGLGSSYPQAIPAILIGLLLAKPRLLQKFPALSGVIRTLEPHAFVLGLLGIVVGVGSLLFGCILPVVCGVPF